MRNDNSFIRRITCHNLLQNIDIVIIAICFFMNNEDWVVNVPVVKHSSNSFSVFIAQIRVNLFVKDTCPFGIRSVILVGFKIMHVMDICQLIEF